MGHKPDWQNQSHKKTGGSTASYGVTSKPIFHGEKQAVRMLADGSESDPNWMAGENYGDGTTPGQRVAMSGGDVNAFIETERKRATEAESNASKPSETKRMSFSEAFKSAKDGSNFEWNGKQYKKEYAQPVQPTRPITAKVADDATETTVRRDVDNKEVERLSARKPAPTGKLSGSELMASLDPTLQRNKMEELSKAERKFKRAGRGGYYSK